MAPFRAWATTGEPVRTAANQRVSPTEGAALSIYATYWVLKFPRYGDAHTGCSVKVIGQGVPAHAILHAAKIDTFSNVWNSWVSREFMASLCLRDKSSKQRAMAVVNAS